MSDARFARIAAIVGAVARQALADRGAERIALLDDGGPEADLSARMLARALGEDGVIRITVSDAEVESVLHLSPGAAPDDVRDEIRRMRARLAPGALPAHPGNKTALLLNATLPPEPLLPLGDLWASEAAELGGGWSAPPLVCRIAEQAGGINALDEALRAFVDRRDPGGLGALPRDAADAVRGALAAGRAARMFPVIVPKVGTRTLGVDLFD
ncbi:MAG TPA: hypothetical protein VFJ16_11230 [Longimicrobium sp.]|nr:hypothetical protein [Longimicrobium sp.]